MMRLNKFLALAGIASRRKADEFIASGKIKINKKIIKELGTQVDEFDDIIEYDGEILKIQTNKIYIALNKPVGYVSSANSSQGKTVLDLIKIEERIYPVGRLDKDSRGLIIISNDGDFAYELTHAKFECEKEYAVRLDRDFGIKDAKNLEKGMIIDGIKLQPAKVTYNKAGEVRLIIKEGINRQIRKMMGHLDYRVLDLQRIRIGKLRLDSLKLKEGEYKMINKKDVL